MMRRTVWLPVGLWALLGALLPLAAHSLESEVETTTRPDSFEPQFVDRALPRSAEAVVNIEERVRFEESATVSDLTREYTFAGTENDLIVVYWESSDDEHRGVYAELYDAEGQLINLGNSYEEGTNFAEFRGRHQTFLLPAAGIYRLVFGAYGNYGFATDPERDRDYLLRVRVASEYELMMMSAADLIEFERFQEALVLFSQAIEQRPEQPLPYFGRMLSQAGLVLETAGLTKDDVDRPTDLYKLYQVMDVEAQMQVLNDLQKFEDALLVVMENENLTEEDVEMDFEFLGAISQYFETGEQPEYLESMNEDAAPTVDVLEAR